MAEHPVISHSIFFSLLFCLLIKTVYCLGHMVRVCQRVCNLVIFVGVLFLIGKHLWRIASSSIADVHSPFNYKYNRSKKVPIARYQIFKDNHTYTHTHTNARAFARREKERRIEKEEYTEENSKKKRKKNKQMWWATTTQITLDLQFISLNKYITFLPFYAR